MIHYLTEAGSGNSELKNRRWYLPDGLLSYLLQIRDNNDKSKCTENPTVNGAYQHLEDLIQWNTEDKGTGKKHGITYQEMKRIKNWFDKRQHASNTTAYELYGGDRMKTWVDGQLSSATTIIKQRKEAEKAAGKENAFLKAHTAERGTTITKVDNTTPTYNPATGNKLNKLKELNALNEKKVVVLNEEQIKVLEKLFIKK